MKRTVLNYAVQAAAAQIWAEARIQQLLAEGYERDTTYPNHFVKKDEKGNVIEDVWLD